MAFKELKEHPKMIGPSDDRFGEMLNYAVRYALGRRSYAVGDTVSFIMPLIPYLTTRTLYVMHRDIKEQAERDLLGMDCDKVDWMKLYKAIGEEMERRKE